MGIGYSSFILDLPDCRGRLAEGEAKDHSETAICCRAIRLKIPHDRLTTSNGFQGSKCHPHLCWLIHVLIIGCRDTNYELLVSSRKTTR